MGLKILRRLSTLRHGKGYGVHSPLAYELISSVLPDHPAYYADRQIEEIFRDKRQRRTARILLRLIAHFGPSTVSVSEPFIAVVKLSDSRIRIVPPTEEAHLTLQRIDNITTITIGKEDSDNGPLILDNECDLRIVIYRKGLSAARINTTL